MSKRFINLASPVDFKINIDFWFSKAIKSKIYPKVDLLFLDLFKRIGHDIIGKGISFLQSLLVFLKQKIKIITRL